MWLSSVLLLVACGDKDTGAVENPLYYDVDGDGFTSDVDCDDNQAEIHPDAQEICDGMDNDCDFLIDMDDDSVTLTAWYIDGDGDGFGAGDPVMDCEAPVGTVDNDVDCDDVDATIHPEAIEMCDLIDNDCDALIDDADDISVDVGLTWYIDVDGDSFGDPNTAFIACEGGENAVDVGEDCDDSNNAIFPDAIEVCDNLDNDCDGLLDAQEPDLQCDACTDVVLQDNFGEVLSNYAASGDDATVSCGSGLEDVVLRWTAPTDGEYIFQSNAQVMGIWQDCGESELACNQSGELSLTLLQYETIQIVLEDANPSSLSLSIHSLEEMVCDDGADDDNDGLADCDDELDCWFAQQCGALQCPNYDLISPIDYVTPLDGLEMLTSTIAGFQDDQQASCFLSGGEDITYAYTAVSNGCALIFASSNTMPVSIAVYDSCGGNEIDCNQTSNVAINQTGRTYGSYLPLQLSENSTYIITVDGVPASSTDSFVLGIERNDTMDCAGNILQ